METIKQDWKDKKHNLFIQFDYEIPEETNIMMSLNEFKERFKNIEKTMTTIAEPPIQDYIANIGEGTHLWLSISMGEIEKELPENGGWEKDKEHIEIEQLENAIRVLASVVEDLQHMVFPLGDNIDIVGDVGKILDGGLEE
jgi:predicted RNase H-like nuclease (RuvC/YqgF family)